MKTVFITGISYFQWICRYALSKPLLTFNYLFNLKLSEEWKLKITAYFKQRNKFVFGNVHVCIVHIKYHVHIAYEIVMCMLYMFVWLYVYACLHAHECDTLAGVGEILDVNALAIVSEGAMCSI